MPESPMNYPQFTKVIHSFTPMLLTKELFSVVKH